MLDKTIFTGGIKDPKIMSYYFDKFNVKLKDINPFPD